MDMNMQAVLIARFIAAIRKSFKPCPLIGEKWFQFPVGGKPADFQFVGINKLAKATSRKPGQVAEMIVGNLDLKGIDARVDITSKQDAVNIRLNRGPAK